MYPSTHDIKKWLSDEFAIDENSVQIMAEKNNPSSRSWVVNVFKNQQSEKLFVKHHNEAEMFSRECNALSLLQPYSSGTEKYAVPELLSANSDMGTIAIKWIEGKPVGKMLSDSVKWWSGSEKFNKGLILAKNIGTWLRQFEERTVLPERHLYPEFIIQSRIDELIELINHHDRSRSTKILMEMVGQYVGNVIKQLSGTYEFSLLHRDFWFSHVLETSQGIAVLDYGRCVEGPRGRDAAEFLLRLDDFTILNPMISTAKKNSLENAFLTGYSQISRDDPVIQIYMVLRKLEQLGGLVEVRHKALTPVMTKIYVAAHKSWLKKNCK